MANSNLARWRFGVAIVGGAGLVVFLAVSLAGPAREELRPDDQSPQQQPRTSVADSPQNTPPQGPRTPLQQVSREAPMPTSAPAPWRNPGRDKAGFSGVGFFGQKYHPAIVPTAALGDDLAAALESSDWFNPKKILLTAEEREVLKETAGAMLGHFHDEKNKASDITQEAFERKRRAREYVEDYPAGATFPKMEEMTAKYLGDRNDRQISLEWRDGGFKVVIITLEDSPEAFQAKARRGAAYDQLVDYLFAFFEDCVNKK